MQALAFAVSWVVSSSAGLSGSAGKDNLGVIWTTLLDRGVDLSTVSKLVEHASGPAITAKYDRRDERAKHAAAETITVPYVFQA